MKKPNSNNKQNSINSEAYPIKLNKIVVRIPKTINLCKLNTGFILKSQTLLHRFS